jgi:exodeoxyribonuclease VII small subunit
VEIIVAKKKPGGEEPVALTFEESLGELEEIVTKLEGGKLGLSDALAAYETGVQRLKACYQILQHAERRIELVQSLDANGRAKTTPLDDDESDDLAEKSAARSRRRTSSAQRDSDRVDDDGSLF